MRYVFWGFLLLTQAALANVASVNLNDYATFGGALEDRRTDSQLEVLQNKSDHRMFLLVKKQEGRVVQVRRAPLLTSIDQNDESTNLQNWLRSQYEQIGFYPHDGGPGAGAKVVVGLLVLSLYPLIDDHPRPRAVQALESTAGIILFLPGVAATIGLLPITGPIAAGIALTRYVRGNRILRHAKNVLSSSQKGQVDVIAHRLFRLTDRFMSLVFNEVVDFHQD